MNWQDTFDNIKNFDVSELDFNNAGIWPMPVKVVFLLLVFGLVLGGGYWFFVKDLYTEVERAAEQEQELRQEYERKAYRVANLDRYRQQMVEMEETFGALVRQLPSDTEVPGLLEDITNTALGSGLDLQEFALQDEVEQDFYVELPINIRVRGTYHELATFVSSVAGLPRIVTLHDFSISRSDGNDELRMQMVAKTYRYRAGGEQ
ncbi:MULTISPECIES: type 4a pilus biogenesis protein PilO [Gammaproteobacteria]|uniref:Type 4a pilus biogenesis protein PilO n=1 Tax=Vreelandella halophila TaxID=86177 RepID=A0A9X4YDI7_9GAMM|nr:type 4a pilus biogenesis protein PilO [Halospina sp. K52047b]KAA8982518.1 type 4a pilus biogenesis protein PilO [Halospina sp. K52047b]MYL27669.1 type 4a pilus biogenesis protein PilO [Halomonas utahensis]MYL75399.1 type 4a pilus biogenesis protein PilO [Halomonas sp. 22501_18_FS]